MESVLQRRQKKKESRSEGPQGRRRYFGPSSSSAPSPCAPAHQAGPAPRPPTRLPACLLGCSTARSLTHSLACQLARLLTSCSTKKRRTTIATTQMRTTTRRSTMTTTTKNVISRAGRYFSFPRRHSGKILQTVSDSEEVRDDLPAARRLTVGILSSLSCSLTPPLRASQTVSQSVSLSVYLPVGRSVSRRHARLLARLLVVQASSETKN